MKAQRGGPTPANEAEEAEGNSGGGRRELTLLQHSPVCVDGLIDDCLSISSLGHLLALHANLLALQDQKHNQTKMKRRKIIDFVERLWRD